MKTKILLTTTTLMLTANAINNIKISSETTDGFLYTIDNRSLNDYIMNWILFGMVWMKMIMCNFLGLWGIFWFDDNGIMGEECYLTGTTGARATYRGTK